MVQAAPGSPAVVILTGKYNTIYRYDPLDNLPATLPAGEAVHGDNSHHTWMQNLRTATIPLYSMGTRVDDHWEPSIWQVYRTEAQKRNIVEIVHELSTVRP